MEQSSMEEIYRLLNAGNQILVTDFDKTITESGSSIYASVHVLGKNSSFGQAREALYQFYHKRLPEEAKHWWQEQMKLYIREQVLEDTLKEAAELLRERSGCVQLLKTCISQNVPVWIVSAGLGNVIDFWLENHGISKEKVHVLANYLVYEEQKPVAYTELVTAWNKKKLFLEKSGEQEERQLLQLGDCREDLCWTFSGNSFLFTENKIEKC